MAQCRVPQVDNLFHYISLYYITDSADEMESISNLAPFVCCVHAAEVECKAQQDGAQGWGCLPIHRGPGLLAFLAMDAIRKTMTRMISTVDSDL